MPDERSFLAKYADQFGWNEIVAETAQAWNQLAPAERPDCATFAQVTAKPATLIFSDVATACLRP